MKPSDRVTWTEKQRGKNKWRLESIIFVMSKEQQGRVTAVVCNSQQSALSKVFIQMKESARCSTLMQHVAF